MVIKNHLKWQKRGSEYISDAQKRAKSVMSWVKIALKCVSKLDKNGKI